MIKLKILLVVLVIVTICSGVYYPKLDGDINGDDKVDLFDLALLGKDWGMGCENNDFSSPADIYPDGCIDLKDLEIIGKIWGKERR